MAVSLSPWLDVVIVTGDSNSLMFSRNFPFFGGEHIYLFIVKDDNVVG